MKILTSTVVCLLVGAGATLSDWARIGRNPTVSGVADVIFLVFAVAGFALMMRWRARRQPAPMHRQNRTTPLSERGLKDGVYGLIPHAVYVVIQPIRDHYGAVFAIGEELTYEGSNFSPYHGGHTLYFKPRRMFLQEDANADVLGALDAYLEIVSR